MNNKLGLVIVVAVALVAVTIFAGCVEELPIPTPTFVPTSTYAITDTNCYLDSY